MNAVGLILIAFILLILLRWLNNDAGKVVSTHVINLDSSKERLKKFMNNAFSEGIHVERWPAVNGKALSLEDAKKVGIREEIYKFFEKKKRLGAIGCFLSHQTLLKKLEAMKVGPNAVHLIFEDDAELLPNFKENLMRTINQAPVGWDFLQLGITWPELKRVYGNYHIPIGNDKNYGTFGYLVRHGSLPKINAYISDMKMPIDNQYLSAVGKWNYFCVSPVIVRNDYDATSTINE